MLTYVASYLNPPTSSLARYSSRTKPGLEWFLWNSYKMLSSSGRGILDVVPSDQSWPLIPTILLFVQAWPRRKKGQWPLDLDINFYASWMVHIPGACKVGNPEALSGDSRSSSLRYAVPKCGTPLWSPCIDDPNRSSCISYTFIAYRWILLQ